MDSRVAFAGAIGFGAGFGLAHFLSTKKRSCKGEFLYFDVRGAGEGVRLLYAAAGRIDELSDIRYPIDFAKMKEGGMEAAAEEFHQAKLDGKLDMNLGRAPVLLVEGERVGQSSAIERLVARRFGFYGRTDIEGAQSDAIVEHIVDIKGKYKSAKSSDEATAKFFDEELSSWMEKLEKTMSATEGYCVGSSTTMADVKLYIFCREYFTNMDGLNAALKKCPKIKAAADRFSHIPTVRSYLAARKETSV